MSIASEIQRLKTSKTNIKAQVNIDVDDINEGTDFIDDETLDDYADLIEDMQDAYKQYIPIHTKMIAKGDTSQNGTPTPTSPVDVKVVQGEQVVRVCGKNLFDKSQVQIGKAWNNDTNNARAVCYVPCKPNTDYTISFNSISQFTDGIYWFEKVNKTDTTITYGPSQVTATRTITTNASSNFIGIQFSKSSIASSDFTSLNLQIEQGSVTTFEPYKGKDYKINLTSKNLLPYTGFTTQTINGIAIINNNNGTFTIQGKATSDISYPVYDTFIPMSGTWRMTGCPSGGSSSTYMLSAYVGYWGGGSPNIDTGNGTSITYTGNVKIRFYIKSGTTCNNLLFKPMLTYDAQASYDNFSPYFTPIELCKIGTYQDFIRKGTGKNLLDTSELLYGTISQTDGTTISSNSSVLYSPQYIEVKPNTKYTLSCKVSNITIQLFNYKNDKTYIDTSITSTTNMTTSFTTSSNTYFIRMQYNQSFNIDMQLEEGSFTYYEPYGYKDKWYIEKNVGKVVLNGTETWSSGGTNTTGYIRFTTSTISTLVKTPSANSSIADILCNNYVPISADASYQRTQGMAINTSGIIQIYDNVLSTQTTADFKTWLQSNNTKVYYVLSSPTYTLIENEELLNQLEAVQLQKGENNISVSGDLPMILDLSKYIQIAENHL